MLIPVGLFALALGLRLVGLDRRSIWFDEAVTHGNAHLPLLELLAAARFDVHPPLGYLLYAPWPGLDAGDFWLRFPSAVLGATSVPLTWAWARRIASPSTALVAALLVALAPFQVDVAQEARMYGLTLALGAGSLLALERLLDRPTTARAVLYGLVCTGLLYTHYYGALWLAAQGAVALVAALRRDRPGARFALLALAAAGCFFLPWLPILLAQAGDVREGYWIESPRPATLWITFRSLVAHTPPDYQLGGPLRAAYVVVAVLALAGAERALRSPRSRGALFQFLIPPALAIGISLAAAPVYAVRYLSPIALPFAVLVALGVSRLPTRALRFVGIAVVLFPALVSLPALYTDPGYSRPDLRAAVHYVEAMRQPGEVLLHLAPFTDLPAEYYGARQPARVLQSDDRAELCEALNTHEGGWLLTAYAVHDDSAALVAEAGINHEAYAADLVTTPPIRFLGTSLFHLRPCPTA